MIRRIALLLLGLAMVAAGCGDDTAATTSTAGELDTSTTAGTSTTATAPTTTMAPGTTSAAGGQEIAPELQELVDAAERVRGLRFLSTPTITQLDPAAFAERVRSLIAEITDPEEIVVEQALYEALGILDPSVDLAQAYADLYAEQVAGFYDDDVQELVVPTGVEITPLFKTIIVHELIHALQDQHFEYGPYLDQLIDEQRYEEASALVALIEGDATYFQLVYLDELPADEQVAVVVESLGFDTPVLDSLPAWFGEDLYFPYDQGFGFVQRLVDDGGIAGVNAAYDRLPTTTEQIIHPGKWFSLEGGRPVNLPDLAVPGYEAVEAGVFGQWATGLLLLDGVSEGDSLVAAAGWGGDGYEILWNGTDVAFVMRYEGDTPRDAEELEAALVDSLDARMDAGSPETDATTGITTLSGADFASVDRDGAVLTLVVAGDPAVGGLLAEVMAVG